MDEFKWISIIAALFVGIFVAARIFQGKYMHVLYKYSPMEFSVDSGLLSGILCFISATYFYLVGTETYNLRNFMLCTVTSAIGMISAIIGLTCMVKG